MTPKLPVISGDDMIRVPGKFGYVAARQKGSHVRLRHPSDPQRLPVTVPLHADMPASRCFIAAPELCSFPNLVHFGADWCILAS